MITQVPTTIISGFLGSGKSTIILHLIEWLRAQDIKVVYIKNEVGDMDVDAAVAAAQGIKTETLLNGCICCTIVGPFMSSIDEIIAQNTPDRILIEASGAADPSAIAMSVSSHPQLIRDGVIGVIDVLNFEGYKDLSITSQAQTKFIDLLVFNKVELADLATKKRVVGYVRELNTHSPIVEALEGRLDPLLAFGLGSAELNLMLQQKEKDHSHAHDHVAQDNITAFTCQIPLVTNPSALEKTIAGLPKSVIRVKGIIQTPQGHQLVNAVAGRTTWTVLENPSPESIGKLVVIGFFDPSQEVAICRSLSEI